MKYTLNKSNLNTSDEALLRDLRKTAKKLGKQSVTFAEYDCQGKFTASRLYHRFGGWNRALVKAGLKVTKMSFIPPEELMKNLKIIWDKLGRQPRYSDMFNPLSLYAPNVYSGRFGKWISVLENFIEFQKTGKCPAEKTWKKQNSYKRKAISKSMRYDIFMRDRFTCQGCGRSPATHPGLTLHVDHITPLSKGGKTLPDNLQALCSDCNLGKAAKLSS
ncbi:MAG TPA: HNH endonuclease [Ignavibacteria bacterium]